MTLCRRYRPAAIVALALASCLFAMVGRAAPEKAAPLTYTIRLSKTAAAPGDPLWVRNVLTNAGDRLVSGCIGPNYRFLFEGPDRSDSHEFLALDAECKKGGEFRLAPGARFKWSDKVEVPNVGVGTTSVNGEISVFIWGEQDSAMRKPSGALRSDKVTIVIVD